MTRRRLSYGLFCHCITHIGKQRLPLVSVFSAVGNHTYFHVGALAKCNLVIYTVIANILLLCRTEWVDMITLDWHPGDKMMCEPPTDSTAAAGLSGPAEPNLNTLLKNYYQAVTHVCSTGLQLAGRLERDVNSTVEKLKPSSTLSYDQTRHMLLQINSLYSDIIS